jgi:hypothetical protein
MRAYAAALNQLAPGIASSSDLEEAIAGPSSPARGGGPAVQRAAGGQQLSVCRGPAACAFPWQAASAAPASSMSDRVVFSCGGWSAVWPHHSLLLCCERPQRASKVAAHPQLQQCLQLWRRPQRRAPAVEGSLALLSVIIVSGCPAESEGQAGMGACRQPGSAAAQRLAAWLAAEGVVCASSLQAACLPAWVWSLCGGTATLVCASHRRI